MSQKRQMYFQQNTESRIYTFYDLLIMLRHAWLVNNTGCIKRYHANSNLSRKWKQVFLS